MADDQDDWTTEQLRQARKRADAARDKIDAELRRRGEADEDRRREERRYAAMTDGEFERARRKAQTGAE